MLKEKGVSRVLFLELYSKRVPEKIQKLAEEKSSLTRASLFDLVVFV